MQNIEDIRKWLAKIGVEVVGYIERTNGITLLTVNFDGGEVQRYFLAY